MNYPTYHLKGKVWLYLGDAAWRFVSLPKNISAEIKDNFSRDKRGFGSIRVRVTVGKTTWKTSIFPDKKSESYILPLKAEVRNKEGIEDGDVISFALEIIV